MIITRKCGHTCEGCNNFMFRLPLSMNYKLMENQNLRMCWPSETKKNSIAFNYVRAMTDKPLAHLLTPVLITFQLKNLNNIALVCVCIFVVVIQFDISNLYINSM
jgi:hypothetical protein